METCDVIVIGGGSAAFDAAVAAREHGAERVVMLEKAPESEYGGNARYSGTGFRFWHDGAEEIREFVPDTGDDYFKSVQIPPYTKEEFASDLERMTLGRMDPQLARTLVEEIECRHPLDERRRHPLGASEGACQGRQQAILRARDRNPRRGRRRRPVGAMAADRRRHGYRNPLFVSGQRNPRQHAWCRRCARLHRRRANTISAHVPSLLAPAASRRALKCARAISPAMPTSPKCEAPDTTPAKS